MTPSEDCQKTRRRSPASRSLRSTTAVPGAVQGLAVLQRLRPRLRVAPGEAGRTRPRPHLDPAVRARPRRRRSTWVGSGRGPLLRRLRPRDGVADGERRPASTASSTPEQPAPDRAHHRQPAVRPGAAHRQLQRHRSTDPDGDPLTYAWALDGNGGFRRRRRRDRPRSTPRGPTPSRLRVDDGHGDVRHRAGPGAARQHGAAFTSTVTRPAR